MVLRKLKERIKQREADKRQERAATRQIKMKARAAAFKERETQSVRVAVEKEKISADRAIKFEREGGRVGRIKKTLGSSFKALGSVGSKVATATAPKTIVRRKKKGKKKRTVRRKTTPTKKMVDVEKKNLNNYMRF